MTRTITALAAVLIVFGLAAPSFAQSDYEAKTKKLQDIRAKMMAQVNKMMAEVKKVDADIKKTQDEARRSRAGQLRRQDGGGLRQEVRQLRREVAELRAMVRDLVAVARKRATATPALPRVIEAPSFRTPYQRALPNRKAPQPPRVRSEYRVEKKAAPKKQGGRMTLKMGPKEARGLKEVWIQVQGKKEPMRFVLKSGKTRARMNAEAKKKAALRKARNKKSKKTDKPRRSKTDKKRVIIEEELEIERPGLLRKMYPRAAKKVEKKKAPRKKATDRTRWY